jgi:hypothetical protein
MIRRPPLVELNWVVILLRRSRTFKLERYELRTATTVSTAPAGQRDVPTLIEAVTINLRTTPPTVTGAPLTIPFNGIMRRAPTPGQEHNITLDAAYLADWALSIATQNNL